jgi:hypothetical protein
VSYRAAPDYGGERADAQPRATARDQRVDVDHRFAPIELLKNRFVGWIAEPFVSVICLQVYAIGLERIEGIFDLFEGGIDIEHR